jgi:hypothetical protein
MFDPNAAMPRLNRSLVYLGACLIAGIRLARERQVNVRVIPTSHAIDESVDLAHEIFNRVFRKVPDRVKGE